MSDPQTSTRLAQKLEDVSEKSLKWLSDVLDAGLDVENSGLLRAQSAAANIALNTQLRADALRLRAQRDDNALKTLIDLIARKERSVPQTVSGSCNHPLHSLEHKSADGQALRGETA